MPTQENRPAHRSVDALKQTVPTASQRASEADQHGQRAAEIAGFDELQIARRDLRTLRQDLLRPAAPGAQALEIAAQDFELRLRDTLHGGMPRSVPPCTVVQHDSAYRKCQSVFILPEILPAGTMRGMSGFITRFTRASAVSFLGLAAVSVSHAITFDEWRAAHFTAAELADSSISGAAADPGHFGFTNLLRYTLSLDARTPRVATAPRLTFAVGEPALVFTPQAAASDVFYVLELSPDLIHWSARNQMWEEPGSTPGSFLWWDVQPPGGSYFLRLRMALNVTALQGTPTGLTAALTRPFLGYDVRWTDAATVELGYELQRSVGGGAWSTLAQLPPDTISYRDEPIAGATTYNYRVRALWTGGLPSAWSGEAGGTAPVDSDGDRVPDIWDAFPSDPTRWETPSSDQPPIITLRKPTGAIFMPW